MIQFGTKKGTKNKRQEEGNQTSPEKNVPTKRVAMNPVALNSGQISPDSVDVEMSSSNQDNQFAILGSSEESSQGSSQESNFSDTSYDHHRETELPHPAFDSHKVSNSKSEMDNTSNQIVELDKQAVEKAAEEEKKAAVADESEMTVPVSSSSATVNKPSTGNRKQKPPQKSNLASSSSSSQPRITADQCDQLVSVIIKIDAKDKPTLNENQKKNTQINKDRADGLMGLFYSYIGPIDACYPAIDLIGIRNLNAIFKKIDEISSLVDYIYLKYETDTSIIDPRFLSFYANIMEFNIQIKQNILKRTQLMTTSKITQTETRVKKEALANIQETKEYLNRLYNANKKLTGIVEQPLPYNQAVLEQYMTIQDRLFAELYAAREARKSSASHQAISAEETDIAKQIAKNVNSFREQMREVDHHVSEIKIYPSDTRIVIPTLIYDELFNISRELSYNSEKYEIIKVIYGSLGLTSSAQTYTHQLKTKTTPESGIQIALDESFNRNQILINGMDAGHDMTTFTVLQKVKDILTYILKQSRGSGGGGLPNINIDETSKGIDAILATGTSSNCINVKNAHTHITHIFENIRREIEGITGIRDVPNSYNTEISISKEDMVDVMSVDGLFYPESGRYPPVQLLLGADASSGAAMESGGGLRQCVVPEYADIDAGPSTSFNTGNPRVPVQFYLYGGFVQITIEIINTKSGRVTSRFLQSGIHLEITAEFERTHGITLNEVLLCLQEYNHLRPGNKTKSLCITHINTTKIPTEHQFLPINEILNKYLPSSSGGSGEIPTIYYTVAYVLISSFKTIGDQVARLVDHIDALFTIDRFLWAAFWLFFLFGKERAGKEIAENMFDTYHSTPLGWDKMLGYGTSDLPHIIALYEFIKFVYFYGLSQGQFNALVETPEINTQLFVDKHAAIDKHIADNDGLTKQSISILGNRDATNLLHFLCIRDTKTMFDDYIVKSRAIIDKFRADTNPLQNYHEYKVQFPDYYVLECYTPNLHNPPTLSTSRIIGDIVFVFEEGQLFGSVQIGQSIVAINSGQPPRGTLKPYITINGIDFFENGEDTPNITLPDAIIIIYKYANIYISQKKDETAQRIQSTHLPEFLIKMFELITETYKLFKAPLMSSFQFYSLVMNYIIIRLNGDGGGGGSSADTRVPGIDVFIKAIRDLQLEGLKESYINNMYIEYCTQILRKDHTSSALATFKKEYMEQTGPFHLVLVLNQRGFPRTMQELYSVIQRIEYDSTKCEAAACSVDCSTREGLEEACCMGEGLGQRPKLNQRRIKPMKPRTKKNHKNPKFSIRKLGVKISTKNKQRKNNSKKRPKKQPKKHNSKKLPKKQTQKHKTYNHYKNKSNKNKNNVFRK